MSEQPCYRIRNWAECFETAESRKIKNALSWVAFPTKHDGKSYRRLTAHPKSVQIFCAFALMIEVAAKLPVRGVLADGDGPLSDEDLSIKTGFPQHIFAIAFDVLSQPKFGWLEKSESGGWPQIPAESGGVRVTGHTTTNKQGGFPLPVFEPLKGGLFRRELREMFDHAMSEIKRCKADPNSWQTALDKSSSELVEFLEKEKRDGWERRVAEIKNDRSLYVRTKLTPNAAKFVEAWKLRADEITRAMNGVKS